MCVMRDKCRENSKKRKKCLSTKRRRNELKKIRKIRQSRKEQKEGTTYRSGIGLTLISEVEIDALSRCDSKIAVDNYISEKTSPTTEAAKPPALENARKVIYL